MAEFALGRLLKEIRALDRELNAVAARLKTIESNGLNTVHLEIQLSGMRIQVKAIDELLDRVLKRSLEDELILLAESESVPKKVPPRS